jgi:hypothetical protein
MLLLSRLGCASGADVSASAAVFAFVRVDHVLVGTGGDGGFGAFGFASAAADAVIGNFVSHFFFLSSKVLRIRLCRIAQAAGSVNRSFVRNSKPLITRIMANEHEWFKREKRLPVFNYA